MITSTDYDNLPNLPAVCRENYLKEHKLFVDRPRLSGKVLQVGSYDGQRIIRLLHDRPDLQFTGLEIEPKEVEESKAKLATQALNATIILGDITDPPPELGGFDWVICLNNTLGFIPDDQRAIEEMKRLGEHVVVSVFGEKFTNELARDYFKQAMGLTPTIDGNRFFFDDFEIRRYTKNDVAQWGGDFVETPLGYFCDVK